MNTHMVIRKFTGPGSVELMPGTMVDGSAWPNIEQLESVHFLRPLNANEIETGIPSSVRAGKTGREMKDRQSKLTPATA